MRVFTSVCALVLIALLTTTTLAITLPTVTGANVVYHLEASSLNVPDGQTISSWNATVGPNASTSSISFEPTFREAITPKGTDGVEFDLLNDHMDLASAIPDFESLFVVAQYKSFGEQQMILGAESTLGQKMGHRQGTIFIDGQNISAFSFSSNDFTAFAWERGNQDWLVDNVPTTANLALNTAITGGIVLGAERSAIHANGADNLGPDAVIVEIVAYDGTLSAADRLAVSTALVNGHLIPEPSTLALVCLGGLFVLRRRFR